MLVERVQGSETKEGKGLDAYESCSADRWNWRRGNVSMCSVSKLDVQIAY